jgi:aspartate racemase
MSIQEPRPIGVLGGTSWPSTIDYYRRFNILANETFGGFHSADLLLRSIDYDPIKSAYGAREDEIPELLERHIINLAACNPSCIVIANNTLHKYFDIIEPRLNLSIPVIHIVDAVGKEAQRRGISSALLLAIKFTMEDGFYAERLKRFGISVEIPNDVEREEIQRIQSKLASGEPPREFAPFFTNLIKRYAHLDSVILACTELPLAVSQTGSEIPVLDSGESQIREAFGVYCSQLGALAKR